MQSWARATTFATICYCFEAKQFSLRDTAEIWCQNSILTPRDENNVVTLPLVAICRKIVATPALIILVNVGDQAEDYALLSSVRATWSSYRKNQLVTAWW